VVFLELDSSDFFSIIYTISNMLRFVGGVMFVPALVAFFLEEFFFAELFGLMGLSILIIFSVFRIVLGKREVRFRHAIISIALAWFIIGFISAVPFLFVGLNPLDSFFESVSGWSGTGISMIEFPQDLPQSINFWRGFIQWLGGFGIVLLALLVFEKPQTAHNLFAAEGRSEDFYVNVVKVARTIMVIYFGYTFIGIILFLFSGLSLFESIFHSFTSIATAGFSTHSIGIGFFGSNAMLVSMFLMILGGISFESHFDLMHGRVKKFFNNPEIKFFLGILIISLLLVLFNLFFLNKENFFEGFFYVVSAITSTGASTFVSVSDFPALSVFLILVLMIFGACYGSTTGGLKIWRIIILFRVIRREIHKAFLPNHTVFPIKVGNKVISDESALKALSYLALYFFFIVIGSIIFMLFGYGILESVFTVSSAQGNSGLSILSSYSLFNLHPLLKLLLSLHMIVGRMEILPFLILIKSFGFGSKI
jgi:trk system potassium uptake protein